LHGGAENQLTDITDEKPKRGSTRRTVLLIIGLIFGGCVLVGICTGAFVFGIFKLTQPVVDASAGFMDALKAADYTAAYDLMDSSLQAEFENAAAFGTFMRERSITPESWSFGSRSIENNTGSVSGKMVGTDGTTFTMDLSLINRDGNWLLTGFSFEPVDE
jgi:hypothetical protein